jgi:hypothetical protein
MLFSSFQNERRFSIASCALTGRPLTCYWAHSARCLVLASIKTEFMAVSENSLRHLSARHRTGFDLAASRHGSLRA